MEKYHRFCRLCCSTLDVKSYLLKKDEELTSIGAAFVRIVDIREVDDAKARLCKTCYRTVFAVQKADDELRQRKTELKVKFLDAQRFFSSSKRVRDLSTPGESSPSTKSPAIKRITEGTPREKAHSARALFSSSKSEQTSGQPRPLSQVTSLTPTKPSRIPRPGPRTIALPSSRPKINLIDLESVIDEECDKLCSINRAVFRTTSESIDINNFNWKHYEKELKEIAPTMWMALKAASTSLGTKYKRKTNDTQSSRSCVVAATILLKNRNERMSAFQHFMSLLLWHGNSSTMVSSRLILNLA